MPVKNTSSTVLTCHYETLIILQHLCEEPWDNHLRADQEPDLFLHTAIPQYTASYILIGKIHL